MGVWAKAQNGSTTSNGNSRARFVYICEICIIWHNQVVLFSILICYYEYSYNILTFSVANCLNLYQWYIRVYALSQHRQNSWKLDTWIQEPGGNFELNIQEFWLWSMVSCLRTVSNASWIHSGFGVYAMLNVFKRVRLEGASLCLKSIFIINYPFL